eukprot:c52696_g1_i1 orf=68-295(+)
MVAGQGKNLEFQRVQVRDCRKPALDQKGTETVSIFCTGHLLPRERASDCINATKKDWGIPQGPQLDVLTVCRICQ